MKILLILVLCLATCYMQIVPLTGLQLEALRNSQLIKHNFYRAKHGCEDLVLNNSLNDIAQRHSEHMAMQTQSLEHSEQAKSGQYGENLYWAWGSPTKIYSDGEATNSWYSQESLYTYGSFPPADGTGHFTAMIWKSVKSVGFGYYKAMEMEGQAIYVVANYYPTPNVYSSNYHKLNVLPPTQNSVTNNTSSLPQQPTEISNNVIPDTENTLTQQPIVQAQNNRSLWAMPNKTDRKSLTNEGESDIQSPSNEAFGLNEASIEPSINKIQTQTNNDISVQFDLSSLNAPAANEDNQELKNLSAQPGQASS